MLFALRENSPSDGLERKLLIERQVKEKDLQPRSLRQLPEALMAVNSAAELALFASQNLSLSSFVIEISARS